ncbi:hypothetical protein HKCCE3408_16825, partial [Rhodobacterales bacterium HKCCE3408]|nr:hypothetical protein [Rhodobacterales bacterium HKCCE3408]
AAAALDAGVACLCRPGQLSDGQAFPSGAAIMGTLGPGPVLSAFEGTPQAAAE